VSIGIAPSKLPSSLDFPAIHPGGNPSTYLLGSRKGSRASLYAMEKREISLPCWESNPFSFDLAVRRLIVVFTEMNSVKRFQKLSFF
jgi:hypothetical protein